VIPVAGLDHSTHLPGLQPERGLLERRVLRALLYPAEVAAAVLGPVGRLIAMSKFAYLRHSGRVVVFNAGICLADGVEIWAGDLDLTIDETRIAELARRLGARVYVLIESDRAWLRGESQRSNAICVAEADGRIALGLRWAVRGPAGTLERPG